MNEREEVKNEDTFYEIGNNEDEELLGESQGANKNKWIYVFLGISFAAAAAAIFYVLLDGVEQPIVVEKVNKTSVKPKVFALPKVKEKKKIPQVEKPVFPVMPKMPTMEAPKIFTPKLFKGGGGTLDISSKPKVNKVEKILEKKEELGVKSKIKAYKGGSSTVAGVHHYDANLFLPRGTLIPCSMDTRLISMVSGQIKCTVSEDMYSANGNILLIEKGSVAVGTYKTESLKNGMNRIYAIWEDIRTPNNIIISVGSGAADELGANGMTGQIDNHWAMRFGGAVLLSIIDDSLNMVNQKHNNQNGLILSGTTRNSKRMGEMALKQYIDIPPTLYKDHGDTITIFLNKDIDFSEVYGLER